ncbi:hypothetical protein HUJ05_007105 [Dendroctonus ponderosae]|nr:hypothetical protein HUJ05_007105 [Dendroctonus ponderosae]
MPFKKKEDRYWMLSGGSTDNFRPYLTSFQGNNFTDYINAVFVDGYTKPREYIVTEWPLKSTLGEFWSLVYDYECSAVVVLCVPPHNSQQFPSFWPEGRAPKKYGPVFTIDHISHNHYSKIKTWVFRINKKVKKPVSNSLFNDAKTNYVAQMVLEKLRKKQRHVQVDFAIQKQTTQI